MGMVMCLRLASPTDVARLFDSPDDIFDFVNSEEGYRSEESLDFDKEWHAVHFLLTKSGGATDNPLSLLIGNHPEVGPDHGYGAAWLAPAEALAAFHDALAIESNEALVAAYDSAAMVAEDVYIAETLHEEGEEALGFLLQHVDRLRVFAARGKAAGSAMFGLLT
jgi:Domain of unknown function (DUF1877)